MANTECAFVETPMYIPRMLPQCLQCHHFPGYREERIFFCLIQCCAGTWIPKPHWVSPEEQKASCENSLYDFFSLCASLMLNSKTNTQTPSISVRKSHSTGTVQTVPGNIFPHPPHYQINNSKSAKALL